MSAPADCTASLLTSPTAGAIAAVSLRGPGACSVFRSLVNKHSPPSPGEAAFHAVYDGADLLDEAVVLSDEVSTARVNVTEVLLCVHGGTRIVERLLDRARSLGCDVASSNPSTVFHDDALVQREALDSLHLAKTPHAVDFLLAQRRLLPILAKDARTQLRSRAPHERTWADGLQRALAGFDIACRLLHGTRVALIGPTNAGKSTLLNRLAGRDAAVTSDRAGTTRDFVEAEIEIRGFPVTLIDTAGGNVGAGELESKAISVGANQASRAQLRILVLDASASSWAHAALAAEELDQPDIIVWNKTDRNKATACAAGERELCGSATQCRVSALTGEGMADLHQALEDRVAGTERSLEAPTFFTTRQRDVASAILAAPIHTSENVAEELALAFL